MQMLFGRSVDAAGSVRAVPPTAFRWRLTYSDGRQEVLEADSVRRTEVLGEIGLFYWAINGDGSSELREVARVGGVAQVQRLRPGPGG